MYFTDAELRLLMLRSQLRQAQRHLDVVRRYQGDVYVIQQAEQDVALTLGRIFSAQDHVDSERALLCARKDNTMEAIAS
jgi:hypothetical protein